MAKRKLPVETVGPRAEDTWQEGLLTQAARTVIIVLAIGNLSCIGFFFLTGFGVTKFTDYALGALAAATVGQIAGLAGTIMKSVASMWCLLLLDIGVIIQATYVKLIIVLKKRKWIDKRVKTSNIESMSLNSTIGVNLIIGQYWT